MLYVKTYIDKSPIHGIGLFADQKILNGQLVWAMHDLDMCIDKQYFEALPKTAQDFIHKHGDWDIELQKITMSFDNDKFINHSDTPNLDYSKSQRTYANKDIYPGEEITINYYDFDEHASLKLGDMV